MPAVSALEFAADERFVTKHRYFVAVRYRVSVRAGFGKFDGEAASVRVPELM